MYFDLTTWPDSQMFIGKKDCHLIVPPAGRDSELDSAYMVPSPDGEYEKIPWPDAQEHLDAPGTLTDYDGNVFVPIETKNK